MATTNAPLETWFTEFVQFSGNTELRRMGNAAGAAGKIGSIAGASSRVGADMRLSGLRSKAKLTVGYDVISPHKISLNYGPPGLFGGLAQEGRKASGPIYPRLGRGRKKGVAATSFGGAQAARAVKTPYGYRARSSYGPQRKRPMALTYAIRKAEPMATKAYYRQFNTEVRRALPRNRTYRYRVA